MLLLPGAIAGIITGTIFITNVPPGSLRLSLGVIVLIIAIYKLFENNLFRAIRFEPRNWHGLLAGTVAGFSSTLAHAGGPPVSVYLLLQDLKPRTFIASSALFFGIINWIKVPFYLYAGLFDLDLMRHVVSLLWLLPVGVFLGKWASNKISKQLFDKIASVMLMVTALFLILT